MIATLSVDSQMRSHYLNAKKYRGYALKGG